MKTAHTGYVKLGSSSPIKVRVRGRYLPIVVVPGFMGTRLSDPVTKKLAWNPTGFPLSALTGATPGPFACDYERLQQVSSPLVPDDFYPNEKEEDRKAVEHIRYHNHMVTPYYGKLSEELAKLEYINDEPTATQLGVKPRVYCCGYDWRQDNAKSAMRLAEVVDEALRDTGEEKCIIVAHSMGGLVARYYCRALGGESKVFAVHSVGSPMLGAPSAYTQLKHGAPGLYVKEYFHHENDDDPDATTVDNAISEGAGAITALATAAAAGPVEGIVAFIGPVYLCLTLGAGRLLTRKETTHFARQIHSAYQLLPSALFCNAHRLWNFFDPLNTGQPPSGYLIKFPTLMDLTLAAMTQSTDSLQGPAEKKGQAYMESAGLKDHADRSNWQLEAANSESLDELVMGIVQFIEDATGDGELDPAATTRIKARVLGLIDRATKSFLDCRNSRALYSDLFTGLMDAVSLRAMSAYGLEMMYRFDDAITVQPREEPIYSALSLLATIFGPIGSAFGALFPETDPEKIMKAKLKAEKLLLEAERSKPKAYIHPRTITYASTNVPVDGGCLLACFDVRSNYDTNVVKFQLIPNLIGLTMPPPSDPSEQGALYWGDGTVPLFSAQPPKELLSSDLIASEQYQGIVHTALTSDEKVITKIRDHVAKSVLDWYRS